MERPSSPVVSHLLRLHLHAADGPSVPMDAELRYRPDDPLAVEAFFGAETEARVRWVFARDLLVAGLQHRAGLGDVSVWPCADEAGRRMLMLRLSSPDGTALMEASAAAVADFLAETELLVPCGSESLHMDIDRALTQLLAS